MTTNMNLYLLKRTVPVHDLDYDENAAMVIRAEFGDDARHMAAAQSPKTSAEEWTAQEIDPNGPEGVILIDFKRG